MRLRPAIRVGWASEHPRATLEGLLDTYGKSGYWDSRERRRWGASGTAELLTPYFRFGLGTGDTALFVLEDEAIRGCVLVRTIEAGDPPLRTVAAICLSPDVGPDLAPRILAEAQALFPGRWRIAICPEKDSRSARFFEPSRDEGAVRRSSDDEILLETSTAERPVPWNRIWFGVEVEFLGVRKQDIPVPAHWDLTAEEWLFARDPWHRSEDGDPRDPSVETEHGAELRTPPMQFGDVERLRPVLRQLRRAGGFVNYSCALHVHLGLQHWGERIVPRILSSALESESALLELIRPSDYRFLFCRPIEPAMPAAFRRARTPTEKRRATETGWDPFERSGLNLSAYWNRAGSCEVRWANGSLDFDEIRSTVELYLKYLATIAAGPVTAESGAELARRLGVSAGATYPAASPVPANCTAVFPCAYRLAKESVFRLSDPTAEYAEEYLSCLMKWFEGHSPGKLDGVPEAHLRSEIEGRRFRCEIRDPSGRVVTVLRETVSRPGAEAIRAFLREHGNRERLGCRSMTPGPDTASPPGVIPSRPSSGDDTI